MLILKTILVRGNPLKPSSVDIIAQTGMLEDREKIKDGWNFLYSAPSIPNRVLIARITSRGILDAEV